MGLFGKKERHAASPTLRPIDIGPGDVALAKDLLRSIEEKIGGEDVGIRRSIHDFSRAVGGVDSTTIMQRGMAPEETRRPWRWLARTCEVAEEQGDTDLAPRAFQFCRWWVGLHGSLTINDYMDMCLDPAPLDARATITTSALTALDQRPGNDFVLVTSRQMRDAGTVRRDAFADLRELGDAGAPLTPAARGLLLTPPLSADSGLLADVARCGRGGWADFAPDITPANEVELELVRRFAHGGQQFVIDVAAAAALRGGWTAVGAYRALVNSLNVDPDDPVLQAVGDIAVLELQRRQVAPMTVTGYERQRWTDNLGSGASWASLAPAPLRGSHDLLALDPGASRHVMTMTFHPTSNRAIVTREGDEYVWYTDRPESHQDDPVRVRTESGRAASQWDIYAQIGDSLQAPPSWMSPDFPPFVRCPAMDLTA